MRVSLAVSEYEHVSTQPFLFIVYILFYGIWKFSVDMPCPFNRWNLEVTHTHTHIHTCAHTQYRS